MELVENETDHRQHQMLPTVKPLIDISACAAPAAITDARAVAQRFLIYS